MYAYAVEELAWAIARERREEARLTRPHTRERPRLAEPPWSWLTRWLAGVGKYPPRDATLRPAGNGCFR